MAPGKRDMWYPALCIIRETPAPRAKYVIKWLGDNDEDRPYEPTEASSTAALLALSALSQAAECVAPWYWD